MTRPPYLPSPWRDWGGTGETVVLMAEPGMASAVMDSVAEALIESFQVLVLDTWSLTPKDLLNDLVGRGITTFKNVSFGAGMRLALTWATEYRAFVERLVLIDPAPITPFMPMQPVRDESWESFRVRMARLSYFSPWTRYHEALARIAFYTSGADPTGEPMALVDLDYARVQCPTLILRATRPALDGRAFSASDSEIAAMALGILGSRLIELKRHDHWSILLNPTVDVADLIRDFLNF